VAVFALVSSNGMASSSANALAVAYSTWRGAQGERVVSGTWGKVEGAEHAAAGGAAGKASSRSGDGRQWSTPPDAAGPSPTCFPLAASALLQMHT
jgi:hypothetical protein